MTFHLEFKDGVDRPIESAVQYTGETIIRVGPTEDHRVKVGEVITIRGKSTLSIRVDDEYLIPPRALEWRGFSKRRVVHDIVYYNTDPQE